MKVELHLIQNFAPSCLNRDDTNTPKDCEFGGYRRARISSQCIKRAIRQCFKDSLILSADALASRTKLLIEKLSEWLAKNGKDKEDAKDIAVKALKGIGLGVEEKEANKTQYLMFIGKREIDSLGEVMLQNWDDLKQVSETAAAEEEGETRVSGRDRKKQAKKGFPSDIKKALLEALDGGKAADMALFGRMLADLPDKNIDAACQVAHAISTNKVLMDMDFYTAVDDLQPEEETGAGMMGITGFNSSCFYRYSLVDMEVLKKNLLGKPAKDAAPQEVKEAEELALETLKAFLRASVTSIPTGKQTSFAAQNPPDAIFAVVRHKGAPVSLANAFAEPVRPTNEKSLMQVSVETMDSYWGSLTQVYGEKEVKAHPICLVGEAKLTSLGDQQVPSFEELLNRVIQSVSFERAK
jgi:CRISPR system Cascade subunit CasC